MHAGQPWEWNALPERTPAESRRLRRRLRVATVVYVAWSVGCLGLHWGQVQPPQHPPLLGRALLLAGGPPLALWAFGPPAWLLYGVLSLVTGVLGGGAVMTWRENVGLSLLCGVWAALTWPLAALIIWIAAF
jgi:hypothetical protein